MRQAIDDLETTNKNTFQASYTYVDEADFQSKLVNAIATGQGPDVVLVPQDIFLSVKSLLYPIPYTDYSQGLFQNSFAQAGEVFLAQDGVYAFPVVIDPIVMFWNRDLLSSAGIALPPKTWTDVLADVPKLTREDTNKKSLELRCFRRMVKRSARQRHPFNVDASERYADCCSRFDG